MKKLFVVPSLLFVSAAAFAQQTGNILGTVRDKTGSVVPDATVTLTNTSTQFSRTLRSNTSGEYVGSSLPIGNYTVTVEAQGFQKLDRSGITLTTANSLTLDMELTVGSTAETIEVTAQASLLQSQSGTVSSLVDSKQVVNLPLATRNFTDLVLLTPGAHQGTANNLGEGGSAYSIRGGANFSVNGTTAATNSYLIDGIYNRNQWLNTLVIVPIVDSIQEYRVLTSSYTAEFGESAGAVTLVSTKNGTNQFHGAAWEFLRNDLLNANQYFAKQAGLARPKYNRNVFGGNVGGPIFRDRTFFFADYQGIRQHTPVTQTTTIPTQAMVNMVKTGNFSGAPVTIYNPYTTTTVGGVSTRTPYAGNNLSADLDPAAAKLASLIPVPTNGNATNNYTITPSLLLRDNQFDVRIDQNLFSSGRLFFKYAYDRASQTVPGTMYPNPAANIQVGTYLSTGSNGYNTDALAHSGTLGYSHVFSANTLLDLHAAIVRWNANVAPVNVNVPAATNIGIPGINYNARSGGLPAFTLSGFSTLGDGSSYPEISHITTFQYDGNLTHTVGNHTIKAGLLFLRHRFNGFSAFPVRGTFDFNGQYTRLNNATSVSSSQLQYYALADLALGATDSASRNILTGSFGMRTFQLAPYVQDTWRATDRLTLDYGVRWEISAPPYEVHNHWANLDVKTGLLKVAGLNGNGRRLRNFDLKTISPRLGLAYTLDGSRKTVLRAGFGISYVDTLVGGAQLYKNLPYYFAQAITTSVDTAPTALLRNGLSTPVAPDPNDINAISTGSPTVWDPNTRQTSVTQFSLGVQRELRKDVILDVSYVGTVSHHLLVNSLNLNQSRPGAGAQGPRRPYYTINPNLVNVAYRAGVADANYNSLQVHAEKRTSGGLNFGVSYTYSKYLSDFGNPNGGGNNDIQDNSCLRCNYGPSADDLRHNLVVNEVYELPFGPKRRFLNHGVISHIAGPWSLSSVWSLHSGSPFTVFYSSNVSNSAGGGTQRPNRVGSGTLSSGRTINHWFDTTAFAAPAQYTFGNSGTGILRGPGYFNVDMTLERHILFGDRYDLNLRGEAFNTFNRANFNNPAATIGSPTAGVISSTQAARILQLAVKLSF
ncbi:MAG TPA: TonB-dependent receptor [Terriglobus sp.]